MLYLCNHSNQLQLPYSINYWRLKFLAKCFPDMFDEENLRMICLWLCSFLIITVQSSISETILFKVLCFWCSKASVTRNDPRFVLVLRNQTAFLLLYLQEKIYISFRPNTKEEKAVWLRETSFVRLQRGQIFLKRSLLCSYLVKENLL